MKPNIIWSVVLTATLTALATGAHAELRVVSLHPYMSDLARKVGGAQVHLTELVPIGENPHTYEPSPDDLKHVAKADVVLACGKKLETYLPELEGALKDGAVIIEVGKTIPSILNKAEADVFVCCPTHSTESIDPHWWHSVIAMKRATQVVRSAFSKADSEHAAAYKRKAHAHTQALEDLHRWVKKQLAGIPSSQRQLVTAHAAFGYFCKDYKFEAISVQELNSKRIPMPKQLAEFIEVMRRRNIRVIFPEAATPEIVLATMKKDAGVYIGKPLLTYSPSQEAPDYISAYRYNVATILEGIKGANAP